MPKYGDSLRGYAFSIHQRDHFRCRYCGLDGTKSFANWTTLSWDHLLPHADARRDNPDFIVTACMFCNTADNRYFGQADARNLKFENKTPDELVDQRRPYVIRTRNSYQKFWEENVRTADASSETKPQENLQTVLEVGSEGGTLAIVRQRDELGKWEYWCLRDETTMLHSLPDDEIGSGCDLREDSDRVGTLEGAMLRLDQYPWYRLVPMKVSADFADLVLREVKRRGGKEAADEWAERLKLRDSDE